MITFITGVPGASKTLNTIKHVHETWTESGRPIYQVGIKDLTLPWKELQYEDIHNWMDLPDNSVVVIDEAWQVWPGRPNNKPVPKSVDALATHRHRGFDFYIITQKYSSVDHAVRGYAGSHVHYERQLGWEGCRRLEFQKAVDPDDYHARQEAMSTRVKFDKKYYGVYKSAEVHTFKKRIPKKLWYLAALFLVIFGLGYTVFSSATNHRALQEPGQFDQEEGSGLVFLDQPKHQVFSDSDNQVLSKEEYLESWQPRLEDIPHSAPAYDQVTEVKTFPRPQCMYAHKTDKCKCFTQQATPLEISRETCMNIVNHGWFNPYHDEEAELARAQPASSPQISNPINQVEDPIRIVTIHGDNSVSNDTKRTVNTYSPSH